MFKRKIRKLMRDPKLFFADMAIKRRHNIDVLKPKGIDGHYQYTVISAVYNVGRYLDEYIESVTRQHLDFKKHLYLILVDDGSTDDSANIIKKWQKKYPSNIKYIYKENGGQASARNLGMQYVKTEWVTFADPDDILDLDYFNQIDTFIFKQKQNEIVMLCNNFIYYFDDKKIYKDSHPLKYRFKKGDALHQVNNLGKNMQLAVNSAIFKSNAIIDNNIIFDDKIKPNFEDAHFIGCYLSNFDNGHIGFISKAKYYYRKRSDGSSTLDTAWEKKGLYDEVLQYGCIDLFNKYITKTGEVPQHVQRTVLYHLIWYFKRLVNNHQKMAFLSTEEITKFKSHLNYLFKHIDTQTIIDFELAGCWFYHKVALLGLFKQTNPTFQIAYIEAFDHVKKMIEIRYFTKQISFESFNIDEVDIIPSYAKSTKHDFLEDTFVIERRVWIPISKFEATSKSILKVDIGDIRARVSLAGKQHVNGVPLEQIITTFESQKPTYKVAKKYQNSWLLMDRNTQADDNAEHLYRYIKNNYPEQDIHFVLDAFSNDWLRLSEEGFNMLAFGSDEHEVALRSCKKLISSHIDKYVSNYLGPKMLAGRHLVFLQHGVIKDNLSGWLNSKEAIDCFITTTPDEYNSITCENSPYKFTHKNVALTGLPRHDALIKANRKSERLIVIMPTWRKTLVGNATDGGNSRELNPEFMKSDFAKHWFELLHSPSLKLLVEQYSYKIVFYPHANVSPYLSFFNVPAHIEVMSNNTMPIQDVFLRAAIMITDYSSVAFDMAVLDKPSIYYQFDEESFFNGGHAYTKGYYDYRKHGFGPVVTNQNDLLIELENMLSNNGKPNQEILSRIEHTFPFRDGLCCERVYQAIKNLDNPDINNDNSEILLSFAEHASLANKWPLAASRWRKYFALVGNDRISFSQRQSLRKSLYENNLIIQRNLREQGRFIEANNVLHSLESDCEQENLQEILKEKFLLSYASREWQTAIQEWNKLEDTSENIKYLFSLAEAHYIENLKKVLNYTNDSGNYENALIAIAQTDWEGAVSWLNNALNDEISIEQKEQIKLFLTKAYRHLGNYKFAESNLNSISMESQGFNEKSYEKIALAFATGNFKECKKLLAPMNSFIEQLPVEVVNIALKTYYQLNDADNALSIINKLEKNTSRWYQCLPSIGDIFFMAQHWEDAEHVWEELRGKIHYANSRLLNIYIEQGKIDKALSLIDQFGFKPDSIHQWSSCAELYSLVGRWDEAAQAWHHIIINYRHTDTTLHAWSNLRHAQMMNELKVRNNQMEYNT